MGRRQLGHRTRSTPLRSRRSNFSVQIYARRLGWNMPAATIVRKPLAGNCPSRNLCAAAARRMAARQVARGIARRLVRRILHRHIAHLHHLSLLQNSFVP